MKVELTGYVDELNRIVKKGKVSRITIVFWLEHLEGSAKAGVGEGNQEFGFGYFKFVMYIRHSPVDGE